MIEGEKSVSKIVIRRGQKADIPALLDIYNYEVLHGVATLDLEPRTLPTGPRRPTGLPLNCLSI